MTDLRKKYTSPTVEIVYNKDESDNGGSAVNRYSLPYGLCQSVGINTRGMTPREAWEAYEEATGKTKEQAEKEHWGKEDKATSKKSDDFKETEGIKSLKELEENKDFASLISDAKSYNLTFKKPSKKAYSEKMEADVIASVGGGDLTRGSCVSVALAYAMNKFGFSVTDYRGGASQNFFSRSWYSINEIIGGQTFSEIKGTEAVKKALATTVQGEEYLFCAGSHCATIRKTPKGYEFLELQSPNENGYKPLTMSILKDRFGFKKSRSVYGLELPIRVNIVSFSEAKKHIDELYYLCGYLNTSGETQQKGELGSEK